MAPVLARVGERRPLAEICCECCGGLQAGGFAPRRAAAVEPSTPALVRQRAHCVAAAHIASPAITREAITRTRETMDMAGSVVLFWLRRANTANLNGSWRTLIYQFRKA